MSTQSPSLVGAHLSLIWALQTTLLALATAGVLLVATLPLLAFIWIGKRPGLGNIPVYAPGNAAVNRTLTWIRTWLTSGPLHIPMLIARFIVANINALIHALPCALAGLLFQWVYVEGPLHMLTRFLTYAGFAIYGVWVPYELLRGAWRRRKYRAMNR